jgi:hypothetical protein
MRLKWGKVVADLCGVSAASCYRWMQEYKNTGLRAPSAPGPLALDQNAYQQRFGDLLAWAECVCRDRRQNGMDTCFADLASIALENQAFKDEVIRGLLELETEATDSSQRLLDVISYADPDRDDPEQEDFRNVVQLCVKGLLSKMGFAWCPLLRGCMDLVMK